MQRADPPDGGAAAGSAQDGDAQGDFQEPCNSYHSSGLLVNWAVEARTARAQGRRRPAVRKPSRLSLAPGAAPPARQGTRNPRSHAGDVRFACLRPRSVGVPASCRHAALLATAASSVDTDGRHSRSMTGSTPGGSSSSYEQMVPMMLHNDPTFLKAVAETVLHYNRTRPAGGGSGQWAGHLRADGAGGCGGTLCSPPPPHTHTRPVLSAGHHRSHPQQAPHPSRPCWRRR